MGWKKLDKERYKFRWVSDMCASVKCECGETVEVYAEGSDPCKCGREYGIIEYVAIKENDEQA